MKKDVVSIFFACDEKYLAPLAVSIRSLVDNISPEREYRITVLYTDMTEASQGRIATMATPNCSISFVDVNRAVADVTAHFALRDYYSFAIYYRLFIPSMFSHLDKALYLDCDVVIDRDIADLYDTELGEDNLVAVVSDAIIAENDNLRVYAREAVGVSWQEYFNSGVMVMNLKLFRELDIEGKFVSLLTRYGFPTIAPDQDYLNNLCRTRAVYLHKSWNKMYSPLPYDGPVYLVHYNMFLKPWFYTRVPFGDIFWRYAERTEFYEELKAKQESYTKEQMEADDRGLANMMALAADCVKSENNFAKKFPLDPIYKELFS